MAITKNMLRRPKGSGEKRPSRAVFSRPRGVMKLRRGRGRKALSASVRQKKTTGFLNKGLERTKSPAESEAGPSCSQSQPSVSSSSAGQARAAAIDPGSSSDSDD